MGEMIFRLRNFEKVIDYFWEIVYTQYKSINQIFFIKFFKSILIDLYNFSLVSNYSIIN